MLPAARVTDLHVCPLFDGLKPHVGGPISGPGATNVLICGQPAARVGDAATCAGPPDAIATGSPTVLIGGMQAARATDITVHGGIIAPPAPINVMIGGPAPPPPPPAPPAPEAPEEDTD